MTSNTPPSQQIKLETKQSYMLLKEHQKSYYQQNNCTNQFVDNLSLLFNDHGTNVNWFLEELLSSTSRGITGSLSRIIIKNNRVTVQPSYTLDEDADDFATEIDRNELIRIALEWENLALKRAPLIYIYRQNDQYFVSDTLPEGVK